MLFLLTSLRKSLIHNNTFGWIILNVQIIVVKPGGNVSWEEWVELLPELHGAVRLAELRIRKLSNVALEEGQVLLADRLKDWNKNTLYFYVSWFDDIDLL